MRGQIAGPFTSADGKAIETIVPVNLGASGWNAAAPAADSLRAIAESGADGLTVHIAGPLGTAADSSNAFKGIDGTLLFSALAVVIVLLLLTYRSPVLWLLPVLSAGVALITAEAVIYLLAAHAYSASNWVAMHCRRHMELYGTTKEQLGWLAINSRRNAGLNPLAAYRDPMTMADYLTARPVADPLGLYDCDVPVDGSIATTEPRRFPIA